MSTKTNPLLDEANYTRAAYDVLMERAKQRTKWSAEHDDEHDDSELSEAAAYLASRGGINGVPPGWAHSLDHNNDRRAQLVIAAALLLAEIERIDRAGAK